MKLVVTFELLPDETAQLSQIAAVLETRGKQIDEVIAYLKQQQQVQQKPEEKK